MKKLLLPIALALFWGCAAARVIYLYETDLQSVIVGGEQDNYTRLVPKEKDPIPPVEFGKWFVPSSWAIKLAAVWAELPFVFDTSGPEYCSALGVDKNRMLHASVPVRYRDTEKAAKSCPSLVWTGDDFMIGLSGDSHSHPTLDKHGERISVQDASVGGPMLVGSASESRIEMSRLAVHFYSGEHLMGIEPATGIEAPVPAQSLFVTRFNGAPHVFLWTPLAGKAEGKGNFVKVYKPAPNDGWQEVGLCWANATDVQQGAAVGFQPAAHCSPNDFWLK